MKKDYIQLVADITGNTIENVTAEMDLVKEKFGVTYAEYYNNNFYELSPNQQAIRVRRVNYKKEQRNASFEKVIAETGMTRDKIIRQIKALNRKYGTRMTIGLYAKFEIYRYQGQALEDFMGLYLRRSELKQQLTEALDQIDMGRRSYDSIENMLKEFYSIVEKIMPESLELALRPRIVNVLPELEDDPEACKRIVVDMEATRVLLGFTIMEYVSFKFYDKNLEEKRSFITDSERLTIIKKINEQSYMDLLDDKYQAYELLSPYYKREMIQIKSGDDYDKFAAFCSKHKTVVIKPHNAFFGRGVKPLTVDDSTDLKGMFDELVEEYDEFLAEELIHAHKKIRKLNEDSVNTVRIITYYDGKEAIVHSTFMKIGRQGSFVDNGGAGGILVSVDTKTGRLNSSGVDEEGRTYECHPDTGLQFSGYKLPKWKKALSIAKELAPQVPGLHYIGWDFTYTKDYGWIIVEGNAKTQFIGQQCTANKGMKKEFLDLLGFDMEALKG